MGYAADFITPPIGPGCWSLGFFFYGCFSSVTWILQFYPLNKRRHWVVRGFLKGVSHFFNGLGVVYILLLLFVFVSFHFPYSLPACLPSLSVADI